jgi:hypothetical protein
MFEGEIPVFGIHLINRKFLIQLYFPCILLLKVLKGSQKCGRIDHTMVASQATADIDRVEELKKKLELVHVELDPGKFKLSFV